MRPFSVFTVLAIAFVLGCSTGEHKQSKNGLFSRLPASTALPLTLPEHEAYEQKEQKDERVGGSPDVEGKFEAQIIRDLAKAFKMSAEAIRAKREEAKKAHPDLDISRRWRGTHSKGSCVMARIDEVYSKEKIKENFATPDKRAASDQQIEILQSIGLLNGKVEKDVRLRFANAASIKQSDRVLDLRAVSMQFQGKDAEYHMTMNNTPRFLMPSLSAFASLTEAFAIKRRQDAPLTGNNIDESQERKRSVTPTWLQARAARKELERFAGRSLSENEITALKVGIGDSINIKSYLSQTYWSGTPFLWGNDAKLEAVVKYGLVGCGKAPQENKHQLGKVIFGKSDNYLQEDLKEQVANEEQCFELFVNFLTDSIEYREKKFPAWKLIENASITWTDMPTYKVAKIVIPRNSPISQDCDGAGSVLLPGHKSSPMAEDLVGLGRINRARTLSELQSYRRRLKEF